MAPSYEVDTLTTVAAAETSRVEPISQGGVKEKDLRRALITHLDGRQAEVSVHKNAEAEILFDLVAQNLGLKEKDYFSLVYYDKNAVGKWLYKKKKISKQVNNLPWEFSLEVKFYIPDPQQLSEDFTRHLFTLQLRADLYQGKLPATYANQARLGSLIAQAELGDYKPNVEYVDALRALNIVPSMSKELSQKICLCYKDQKGKQPPEAELEFLLACRENAMYGMSSFNGKERGKPVRICINAFGISVFQEQLRIHYIIWAIMNQLEYQRKFFTIKLKPGEKEGKNNLSFKLDDESAAKRCWKTAVDHHMFFRLVDANESKHRSLLGGSGTKSRAEGRTLFQTTMASQMFDSTPSGQPVNTTQLVSNSQENVTYQQTTTLKDEETEVSAKSKEPKMYTMSRSPHELSSTATDRDTSKVEWTTEAAGITPYKEHQRSQHSLSSTSSSSASSISVQEKHHMEERPTVRTSVGPIETKKKTKETPTKHVAKANASTNETMTNTALVDEPWATGVSMNETRTHTVRTKTSPMNAVSMIGDPMDETWMTTVTSHDDTSHAASPIADPLYAASPSAATFYADSPRAATLYTGSPSAATLHAAASPNVELGNAAHTSAALANAAHANAALASSTLTHDDITTSSIVVTSGNRQMETITNRQMINGVLRETIEYRVTILTADADPEAALKAAIGDVTGLTTHYEIDHA